MTEEELRGEAARCRRLANQVTDDQAIAALLQMAQMCDEEADALQASIRNVPNPMQR